MAWSAGRSSGDGCGRGIFLDQRKYQAERSLEAIEDVVEELYERKAAKR